MNAQSPYPVTAEQFEFLTEAVAAYATIVAADRVGMLARIERGAVDMATLARELSLDERSTPWLVAALASLGIIARDDAGLYHAAMPNISRLVGLSKMWDGLDQVLRFGKSLAEGETASGSANFYPGVVPLLGSAFASAAQSVAKHLGPVGARVLDVGAGAAPWSIAVAQHNPNCRVTAVDLSTVIPVTQRAVTVAGVAERYDYLSGDVFSLDLGQAAHDLAMAGNFCHLFVEETNRNLLARLFGVLVPGGKVAIIDVLPNDDLSGPREAILYGLGLLLRTSLGQAYPLSFYADWLQSAGFTNVECVRLPSAVPLSLITAQRPLTPFIH